MSVDLDTCVLDSPKRRCLWHFAYASYGDLRRYYAEYPWNDNCLCVRNSSLYDEHITDVMVSAMKA
ncbi:hypothetical protein E2C01_014816 [Portunus trituberculatus]|uniref:Uncharacterized protein n=1 Tax=Portunus trituberculatus TaxID=210409 RepID=A0A5B7DLF8_PORTR|nr:hypothetical protein [Portunus trituberculatus]